MMISVVIPTYNRKKTVIHAIESALNQTFAPYEIIVVDDGSVDGTGESLQKYSGKIIYHYRPNGGVSAARNFGIKRASGEYIALLDSDDRWLPNKLELQVKYFKEHSDFGMVLCDCYFVNQGGSVIGETHRRKHLKQDGYILENVIIAPSLIPSSVLVKKNVIESVGSFDEALKTAEDLDLHLKIATEYKVGLVEERLLSCTRGNSGLSSMPNTYDDHVWVVERFFNETKHYIPAELKRKALFKLYLAAANGKFWSRQNLPAIKYNYKATLQVKNFEDVRIVLINWLKTFKYLSPVRR